MYKQRLHVKKKKFNQINFIIQYRDVAYVQYRDVQVLRCPDTSQKYLTFSHPLYGAHLKHIYMFFYVDLRLNLLKKGKKTKNCDKIWILNKEKVIVLF